MYQHPLNLPRAFRPSTPTTLCSHPPTPTPKRQAGEKNIRDPVLTHHNVTLTHAMRELLPGSLSVSLCNQSRRHCPKSRGVAFCCGAEFKAERQTSRPATLPEPERGPPLPPFILWRKAWARHELSGRPCPFMLAVAWCYHAAKIRNLCEQVKPRSCVY